MFIILLNQKWKKQLIHCLRLRILNVYVKKIMLNKTKATVLSDKSVKLVAKVYPKNANNKKLLWTSSNKRIATVEKVL